MFKLHAIRQIARALRGLGQPSTIIRRLFNARNDDASTMKMSEYFRRIDSAKVSKLGKINRGAIREERFRVKKW